MFNKLMYGAINILKNQNSVKLANKVLKTTNSNLIINGLYIGNIIDAHNLSFIVDNNISSILNCTEDEPFHQFFSISANNDNLLRIPIKDSRDDENMNKFLELLDNGVEFIHRNKNIHKRNVYVHCYWGLMRSATVIAAYLIKYEGYSVENAIQYIKNCRPYSFSSIYNFSEILHKYQNIIENNNIKNNDISNIDNNEDNNENDKFNDKIFEELNTKN